MRQSLSVRPDVDQWAPEPRGRRGPAGAVTAAVVLSAALAGAAVIDQTGGQSLTDHATALYAPYGTQPDPSLLYGLLYGVAAVGAVLWLLVLRAVRSGRRSARVLAVVVAATTAALAVLLLVSAEYGEQIFPPVWGVLAMLPAVAGLGAAALLRRR